MTTNPFDKFDKNPFDKFDDSPGVMPFVNRAIAGTIGAPADVIAGGLSLIPGVDIPEPIGGRKSIEKGMRGIGIELPEEGREPQTIPEHIGRGVGEVAGLMVPGGLAMKGASRGAGLAGKITDSVWKSVVKHPWVSMTSEVTGGAGAGLGRGIAEQEGMSPLGRTSAEMAGGVIGGMSPGLIGYTPGALLAKSGKIILRKLSAPFSKRGSEIRAQDFTRSKVADPQKTIGTLSEPTISDLPPAVQAGEKRIMTLYKSLLGQDPKADAEAVEQISKSIVTLEKEMRKMGYGSPELLAEITRKRVAAIELGMDDRVILAMQNAQSRLEKIPVAHRKGVEAKIVRDELETLMRAENDKVRAIWREVPKEMPVGVEETRAQYAEILGDISEAQKVDIPAVLKNSSIVKDKKLTVTSLKEMQGLRSKLLEVARNARSGDKKNLNMARIADEVADAILEDVGIVAQVPETSGAADLQAALAATRNFKQRFEQGIVGDILGLKRTGAPAIDPTLTLDVSLGRKGLKGAVDIEKVVVSPEARAATERYLGRSFTDYAFENGVIKPGKAKDWVKNNEAILDQFPELRNKMTDAAGAQEYAAGVKAQMDLRKARLRDPKISHAASFLNAADSEKAVKAMLDSPNMAREMIKQARKDPEALEGLRGGVVEHILDVSRKGDFDDLGLKTLSGNEMLSFLNKNDRTLRQVFTNEQLSRMRRVGKELAKIEKFHKAKAGKPDLEMKDWASTALSYMSRFAGAGIGGRLGTTTGGSLQKAQITSGRFKLLMDKIIKFRPEALVMDAVLSDDPRLLQALLLPQYKEEMIKTPTGLRKVLTFHLKNMQVVDKQMNLWLAGSGKRVFDDVMSEEP